MQKFLLLFMVTVLAVEGSKIKERHRTHLVALNTCPSDGAPHTEGIIVGDGKLVTKDNHQWRCSSGCSGTGFDDSTVLNTSFTFPLYSAGEYEVYFGRGSNKRQLTEHIKVKLTDELPLWHLAKEVPSLINQHIFHHLHWKHFFQRFDNFYPNVGKHFHERLETLTKRRDQIATYVLNKHATTEHLDGNLPPDYECVLRYGLNREVPLNKKLNGAVKNDLISAFEDALEGESKIIEELTKVMKMAGDIDDDELGEFISADVLPPILESMKTLENDIGTLKGMLGPRQDLTVTQATTQVGLLGMFMFDKTRF